MGLRTGERFLCLDWGDGLLHLNSGDRLLYLSSGDRFLCLGSGDKFLHLGSGDSSLCVGSGVRSLCLGLRCTVEEMASVTTGTTVGGPSCHRPLERITRRTGLTARKLVGAATAPNEGPLGLPIG